MQDIVIVVAGGDYGNKDLLFPANQDGVVSVEARTKDNLLWDLSNTSDECVLRFPGESISVLTIIDEGLSIKTANGTSQATAIASGYIALIKDYYETQSKPLSGSDLILLLKELNSKSNQKVDYSLPFKP